MSMDEEIPVWVEGAAQWLSGVDRRTTVRDVIELFIEGGAGGDTSNYEIVERWRQVERPLDMDSRLLKIWSHWGDEKKEVRLCLRRVDHENDSGRGSPVGATHSLKRRRHRKTSKQSTSHADGLHPRRLAELGGFNHADYEDQMRKLAAEDQTAYTLGEKTYVSTQEAGLRRKSHRTCASTGTLHSTAIEGKGKKCCSKRNNRPKVRNSENIEKLMKLILAQGATIQTQLHKLKEREAIIENFEVERHKQRVEKNGRNYLLETYLNGLKEAEVPVTDEEKGNDSGVHTEAGSEQTNDKDGGVVRGRRNSDAGSSRGRSREQDRLEKVREPRSKSESRHSDAPAKNSYSRTMSETSVCEKQEEAASAKQETKESEDIVELRRVQSQVEMWEKVLRINKKLEKEEENLVKLHIQIRRIQSENIKYARDDSYKDPVAHSMQTELESLRTDLDQNSKEIYRNFTKLIEDDEKVVKKQHYLTELISDIERTDHEHARLSELVNTVDETVDLPPPPPEMLQPQDIGISLQVKGQEKPPNFGTEEPSPPGSTPVESLPGCSSEGQSLNEPQKPKIHKISFQEVVQSDDTSASEKANPSPVPNRNLKSILKNRQPGTFRLDDLKKVPVNYGSNISSPESCPKIEKTSSLQDASSHCAQSNSNQLHRQQREDPSASNSSPNLHPRVEPTCYTPVYNHSRVAEPPFYQNLNSHRGHSESFAAAMENPYDHLFPQNLPRREAIYQPAPPPYHHAVGQSHSCYPAPVMVTTKAIVHDNDSSGSSDTSGLSSMYSASPTVDEPAYVLNTLV